MKAVLDASALLAYLQDEPGSEAVEAVLAESVISSVNWAEVVQKSIAAGVVIDGMRDDLEALGLEIYQFAPEDVEVTGQLWSQTRQYGLSLGDREIPTLPLYDNFNIWLTGKEFQQLKTLWNRYGCKNNSQRKMVVSALSKQQFTG